MLMSDDVILEVVLHVKEADGFRRLTERRGNVLEHLLRYKDALRDEETKESKQ